MKIFIPEPLGDELEIIAQQENRSVDEILESMVRQFVAAYSHPGSPPDDQPETKDLFALIAKAADELGESSKEGNISERSREILLTEYPEYLMRRLNEQDSGAPNADTRNVHLDNDK